MEFTSNVIAELIATLVGIFIGTLAAFAVDHHNEWVRKRQRAKIILRSLSQELAYNFNTLKDVRPAFINTPWGRSFYVSTTAWETAISSGDLPDIIGFELADVISAQYALLVRIRYYVDLTTQLWFAPAEIPGYKDKQKGFNEAILETINLAISSHPDLMKWIQKGFARV